MKSRPEGLDHSGTPRPMTGSGQCRNEVEARRPRSRDADDPVRWLTAGRNEVEARRPRSPDDPSETGGAFVAAMKSRPEGLDHPETKTR